MISVFVASQKRVAQFERVIRIEIRNASINRSGCAASGGEALLRWHDAGLGLFHWILQQHGGAARPVTSAQGILLTFQHE